ncbi:glycosyltransferase [Roseofilum sp. Guam]|uniref:glycosyltransferase n=1 Tax=Roseofilum sp. Guam TaxID=2821502 RepID=UPI001B12BD7D|nr:glycosyltransferase [Roseofilum sp. Guam]MBP0028699.1 glycosyltransferase [Roseofilum sp. Guam]
MPGGVDYVLVKLAQNMALENIKVGIIVPRYVQNKYIEEFKHTSLIQVESLPNKQFKFCRRLLNGLINRVYRHLFLVQVIRNGNYTHLIFPHAGCFDQKMNALIHLNIPKAVIIHDLYGLHMQQEPLTKVPEIRDIFIEKAIKNVESAIAVSKFSFNEVRKKYPRKKRLYYAQNAIDVCSDDTCVDEDGANEKTLEDGYIIYYPSSSKGNKNHLLLFQAFKKLLEDGCKCQLILTGKNTEKFIKNQEMENSYSELARQFYFSHLDVFKDTIIARGYLSRKDIEQQYVNCNLVVYPSLYEGFGLPVIESIQKGKRVICSDLTPFREIAELYQIHEYITFFTNNDVESFYAALKNHYNEKREPIDMKLVKSKLEKWTWRSTTLKYLQILDSL